VTSLDIANTPRCGAHHTEGEPEYRLQNARSETIATKKRPGSRAEQLSLSKQWGTCCNYCVGITLQVWRAPVLKQTHPVRTSASVPEPKRFWMAGPKQRICRCWGRSLKFEYLFHSPDKNVLFYHLSTFFFSFRKLQSAHQLCDHIRLRHTCGVSTDAEVWMGEVTIIAKLSKQCVAGWLVEGPAASLEILFLSLKSFEFCSFSRNMLNDVKRSSLCGYYSQHFGDNVITFVLGQRIFLPDRLERVTLC